MMTFEEEERTTFRRLHNNSVHSKATKSFHVLFTVGCLPLYLDNDNEIKT